MLIIWISTSFNKSDDKSKKELEQSNKSRDARERELRGGDDD